MARNLPKPKVILAVTAHWEADKVMVSTAAKPPMLYDYYGFPPEAYKLVYPAPGSPEVGRRVLALLAAAGIPAADDDSRGYDHGCFVPLMLAYPEGTVPVVQMSLLKSMDPKAHLAVGAALAPLRDEGVLIVGSGMSFHNMGLFSKNGFGMNGVSAKYGPSESFDAWLQHAATGATGAKRAELLAAWARAPGGRECHPREEHLIPLMVAAGAAGEDGGRTDFSDYMMGAKISGFVFGDA
ncbi:4,5-DOPA dioxygenase extradiol-like protein [Tetrabaena socialis]|uniref:4,5-DOPA dioxygenase extradiol-like protein n=1 Tax=Tetrabaena socialis TaxID=47790 RepID=A0A2J8A9I0_9CHLO|nr:4,5-DOPA dioxygenase extradiol-like protein [Tetrabaena socialis]|eukprot:PNH09187.1 4,5-DOPA dioxygenase extradiol-like protein [Tetrabaena socialis]